MVQEMVLVNQSHCSILSCLFNSKNMGVKIAFSNPLHARYQVNWISGSGKSESKQKTTHSSPYLFLSILLL